MWEKINKSITERGNHAAYRFSTVSETSHESSPGVDLLTFFESTFDELEGPYHCWLNKHEESKDSFNRDGIFFVLVGAFFEDSSILGCDHVMVERVKFLQQRYPQVHFFGFQTGSSVCSVANQTRLVQTIMKEYITFPILLSNKNFSEMTNGAMYILFKGFRSPLLYHEKRADLGMINKELSIIWGQQSFDLRMQCVDLCVSFWQTGVIKEPHVCSPLRNLLLYFPGCISVDESGNRLFLSDNNHHRIIIFDGDGKILDCIGSSPGFEDGEFESAKLLRPAASFYNAAEDCLYFVDSENHAIRRANMERRIIETLYPARVTEKKSSSVWSWILDKLGMERESVPKYEEFNSESLVFPWHLIDSRNNDIFIINRRDDNGGGSGGGSASSGGCAGDNDDRIGDPNDCGCEQCFETLWVMDLAFGEIKEVVRGFPKIMEICEQMIIEKVSFLNRMPCNWLKQGVDPNYSLEGLPYVGLMSSLATFQQNMIFCDTVGQRVLKLGRESGVVSDFKLSNFGILGLPYWLPSPLERVFVGGDGFRGSHIDHLQCFSVLPGKCEIRVNIDIPEDTELAAPLQEGCIWRQARGSATEVLGSEGLAKSAEKVGVAQQWFDDLDNLVISASAPESAVLGDNRTPDQNLQDELHIECTLNTSPGTSEVIIYAVLYLKLNRTWNSCGDHQEKKAARIIEISNHERSGKLGRDGCIQLMLESSRDLGEVIFMKPLHLRIRLECLDHPKAENLKDMILTNSSIEVNVSLF
ncbi:hypothetical protein HHK36_013031 [Tetracentron sinense]|uniref:NHL domain-containing protein n=1 Tax=Tetracentron sinense TaxID=13715 RepID=A0A835DJA0_TETSI|nr:hypothetical protein HHK36_013031 [Tetracentron sinense]